MLDDFLNEFSLLLNEWRHFSLVSKNTLSDVYEWHFVEAFSITGFLNKEDEIVDFGAGGGVIGIPLLKLGYNISLVERSDNKIFFLKNIMKMQNVFKSVKSFKDKVIIVRGVDSILNLLRFLFPCKKLILFKSLEIKSEIQQALKFYSFDYSLYKRIGNARGKIIIITNIKLK